MQPRCSTVVSATSCPQCHWRTFISSWACRPRPLHPSQRGNGQASSAVALLFSAWEQDASYSPGAAFHTKTKEIRHGDRKEARTGKLPFIPASLHCFALSSPGNLPFLVCVQHARKLAIALHAHGRICSCPGRGSTIGEWGSACFAFHGPLGRWSKGCTRCVGGNKHLHHPPPPHPPLPPPKTASHGA